MRLLLSYLVVFLSCGVILAQEKDFPVFETSDPENNEAEKLISNDFNYSTKMFTKERDLFVRKEFPRFKIIQPDLVSEKEKKIGLKLDTIPKIKRHLPEKKPTDKHFSKKNPPKQFNGSAKFHWKSAFKESLYFLGIQHSFRLIQKKTRREFKGKFFPDWGKSVKNLGGWRDGDSTFTNYVAHPMQGVVTGRIFINNSEKARKLDFGKSKEYWKSRFKAMIWSAVWSAQFELGPISEASIGNVGLYDRTGPNRMGWVDLVITPTAGTGVLIGEDLLDKYILKKWLERGASRTRIKIFRTFFTPFQSFTNVLRGKVPWKRDNR